MSTPRPAALRVGLRKHVASVVFGACGLAVFYDQVVRSGFARIPGDLADARHINLVLEHWFRVFMGDASWRSPNFFFPQPATLGYSEALFLWAPPYSVLRLAGLDVYSAYQGVLIGLTAFGFGMMYVLLHRTFRCHRLVAALVAGLFAFSNQFTTHMGHPHLLSTVLVPLIAYCWFTYADPATTRRSAFRHGMAGAVLMALFLYTSFNVAWFVLFFALWLAIGLFGMRWLGGQHPRVVAMEMWRQRRDGSVFMLAFMVSLTPFVLTYLPVWNELGGRAYAEAARIIPAPIDLINVGEGNWVWGRLMAAVTPRDRGEAAGLFGLGSPILFMACFLYFGLREVRRRAGESEWRSKVSGGLTAAVLMSWMLLVNLNGRSLWWFVFHAVPGASAIRVVNRYQLVLYPAMCIVVAIGLDRLVQRHWANRWIRGAMVVGGVLLLAEQVNQMSTFDKVGERARLARVEPPPPTCRVFFGDHRPSTARRFNAFQTDAAMVARIVGVPTINGYSSNFPKDWDLLYHTSPGYPTGVAEWVVSHQLETGLCSLDLERGAWRHVEAPSNGDLRGVDLMNDLAGSVEEALARAEAVRFGGFYPREPGGRWTNGTGAVRFVGSITSRYVGVEFAVHNPRGSGLRIRVNDRTVVEGHFGPGMHRREIATPDPVRNITFDSDTFVPRDSGMNEDWRRLGVAVSRLTLY